MTKLNKRKVKLAMEGTGAILSIIAEKLGVARQYIYEYLKKNPELEKDLEAERERTLDEYEEKLKEIATEGRVQDSTTLGAVKYILNNKARKRGFAERQEVHTSGETVTQVKLVIVHERNSNKDESSDGDPEQE